jgi:hypothetical protein
VGSWKQETFVEGRFDRLLPLLDAPRRIADNASVGYGRLTMLATRAACTTRSIKTAHFVKSISFSWQFRHWPRLLTPRPRAEFAAPLDSGQAPASLQQVRE